MTPDGWCTVFSKSQQMAKMIQNHLTWGGGTPLFCTFFILYLYNFFLVPAGAPKWCFFNPNMGTGLKNTILGLVVALRKKL